MYKEEREAISKHKHKIQKISFEREEKCGRKNMKKSEMIEVSSKKKFLQS